MLRWQNSSPGCRPGVERGRYLEIEFGKGDGRPTDPMQGGDALFVESVRKAFLVLEALNIAGRPLRLSEIASQSGLGKSGAQRFVHTLRSLGLIRQDPKSKVYALSPRILEYARTFFSSSVLCERAEPILRELAASTGETVNLSEPDGTDILYTIRFPSIHSVSVDLSVGSRLPVFNTAGGRAIVAQWPKDRAAATIAACDLRPWTPFTKTEPGAILEELARVRDAGFALSDQEAFIGDISIAAPVFGFNGDCLAAVNIAVPTPRWTKERVLKYLMPSVVSTAARISADLGRQHPEVPVRGQPS
jgi:IclR family transcriptional regulator, pca regulon regulatory protein